MLNIIANNPYRILGVYANSRRAEIIANKNKATAFLKVGRAVEFPLDLKVIDLFSSANRTVDSINEAEANIAIPKEQIKYAQFWFLKTTPLDDIAFNHLIAGDITQANELWTKKETLSSLQNTMVCHLLEGHWRLALSTADKLYEKYGDGFINDALGIMTVQMSGTDLLHQFVDIMSEELGARQMIECCSGLSFEDYIKSKAVLPLINKITEEVNKAKKIDHKDARARKNAGQSLTVTAKECLSDLKKMLSEDDPQYQIVADKIGLEILQCGIDYYNNSDDDEAAQNAMKLQKYAQSVVVGQLAKQRCDKNVEILKEIINDLPPTEIFAEDKAIKKELENYTKLPDLITHAVTLLNSTKPHLQIIKQKLGGTHKYYLKISTQVVSNALYNLIAEVNEAQKDRSADDPLSKVMRPSYGYNYSYGSTFRDEAERLYRTITAVNAACNCMKIMDTFDMESDFRNDRYLPNKNTLKNMQNQLSNAASRLTGTHSTPQRTTSSSSGGCYIATMAYGSYDHPQVLVLRAFRDNYLAERKWGRDFIRFYYKHSPGWVEKLKNHAIINRAIRRCLDGFVSFLKNHKNY